MASSKFNSAVILTEISPKRKGDPLSFLPKKLLSERLLWTRSLMQPSFLLNLDKKGRMTPYHFYQKNVTFGEIMASSELDGYTQQKKFSKSICLFSNKTSSQLICLSTENSLRTEKYFTNPVGHDRILLLFCGNLRHLINIFSVQVTFNIGPICELSSWIDVQWTFIERSLNIDLLKVWKKFSIQ